MPKRINQLATQFAQDGHLSFNQKCRSLVMQAYGHEALIPTRDLYQNTHCTVFDIDIYHLKEIKWEHLAWRKLLNPFKLLEFIVSLLELLPWFFRRSPIKSPGCIPQNQGALTTCIDKLENCYMLIAWFILWLLSYLAVYLTLSLIRPILAPARYIIRPSIQLAQSNPQVFNLMLLMTLILTGLVAWYLLIGNALWIMAGITLTGSFVAQLGVMVLAAIVIWTLLLKCYILISELFDIYQRRQAPVEQQEMDSYLYPKSSTYNITQSLHGLNPEHTHIMKAKDQGFCYRLALWTGTEELFYSSPTQQKVKKISFLAPYFLSNSTNTYGFNLNFFRQERVRTFLGNYLKHNTIEEFATALKLLPAGGISKQLVINTLMQKMQAMGDIEKIDQAVSLLLEDTSASREELAARLI